MGTVSFMKQREAAAEFVSRLSRSHGLALHRFLMRMLGRKEAAEDVAQDAYLKLYRLSRPDEVTCPAGPAVRCRDQARAYAPAARPGRGRPGGGGC